MPYGRMRRAKIRDKSHYTRLPAYVKLPVVDTENSNIAERIPTATRRPRVYIYKRHIQPVHITHREGDG